MKRLLFIVAGVVVTIAAAGGLGYWLGRGTGPASKPLQRAATPSGPPLYYQDPDGKPFYSAVPTKTADGRAYVPVYHDLAAAPASATPANTAQPDRHILYYRNPMGLPDTSPVPKKDPMGMAYIPVYADEAAAPGTVRLDPAKIQTLGVRTAPVEARTALTKTIRATGIVQFDERSLAVVTTKVAGWLEHLAVAATGTAVRRGQILAQIYSPELVASEQEYLVAADMAAQAGHGGGHADPSGLVAASLERLRALDIPEGEIARLHRTGRAERRIAVRAPEDGVVIDKPALEGMRVAPGDPLYKIADLSTVWLIAEVQEQDLGLIRRGQKARASFVAFPGRRFDGTVDFVYPTLSAETRTGRVRIVMPNPELLLRAAMYASVRIDAPVAAAPVLAVPASAVIDSGTRQVVLVAQGEGRFAPRAVTLGVHGDDWVQVTEGLKPGEQVVVGANFLIDAESNLRAALQAFAPPAENSSGEAPKP